MTDIDTETPTTTAALLADLGELHTRTCVSPLPKHPGARGWQAVSTSLSAGYARALHALNEIAPDKAAEISAWYNGPLGEGPDPEEHTDWLEQHVADGRAGIERWVEDGQAAAVEAKTFTVQWERSNAA